MGAIGAFIRALRYGGELASVEAWKTGLVNSTMVVGLLTALVGIARSFGLNIPVTDAQLADIAVGVVAVGGVVVSLLTAATSKRAGLPGLDPAAGSSRPADRAGVAGAAAAAPAAEAPRTAGDPAAGNQAALPPGDPAAGGNHNTDPFRPGT